jgi:hypothetical protein
VVLMDGTVYDEASGRESRSAFIAMAAFFICAVKFLTNGVTFHLFGHTFQCGTVDAALLGAFLAPCLALYWGRRVTIGGSDDKCRGERCPEHRPEHIGGPIID